MRTPARVLVPVTALVLAVTAGTAVAGPWYYEWSCTGRCSPGQLVIEGREGPFASREDCEWARDHDTRADEFVAEGNLGGLEFCEEDTRVASGGGGGTYVAPSPTTPNKVHISAFGLGLALGTGWVATGEDQMARAGSATLGLDVDTHTGRDVGGGSLAIGLYATRVEAPMLGAEPRTVYQLPVTVGLALTPQVYGKGHTSVRLDLGASLGGMLLFGCSDCAAPVFDETIAFGYTLEAGLDVFTSKNSGFGVNVVFPRWALGNATAGDLRLESPTWMVRVSMIGRPTEPQ